MRRVLLFGAALALATQALHAQQWKAQRVVRVGEEEGVSFGRISDIAPGADGGFYVLDAMESRVTTFSAAGKPLRSFGKRGAGPGELSNLATTLVVSGAHLVIVDPRNQRINLFRTDGSFVRSRPLPFSSGFPVSWTSAGSRIVYLARPLPGMLAAQFGGVSAHTLLAIDPLTDAEPDTLLRVQLPPDNEMSTAGGAIHMKLNLAAAQLHLASDGRSRILSAVSDTYRIRVLDPAGKTTSWISRNVARHRYSTAELARIKTVADSVMAAGIKSGLAAAGARGEVPKPQVEYTLPVHAPAIGRLLAGDRFLLVQRSSVPNADASPSNWDVLGYDGTVLGTLTLPGRFRAFALQGDRVYGVETDELDLQAVAVYRITR